MSVMSEEEIEALEEGIEASLSGDPERDGKLFRLLNYAIFMAISCNIRDRDTLATYQEMLDLLAGWAGELHGQEVLAHIEEAIKHLKAAQSVLAR